MVRSGDWIIEPSPSPTARSGDANGQPLARTDDDGFRILHRLAHQQNATHRAQTLGMLDWLPRHSYLLPILGGDDGPFRLCAPTSGDLPARHEMPSTVGAP